MDVIKWIPVLALIVTLAQFLRTVYQAKKTVSHQVVSSRRILGSEEERQFNLGLLCSDRPVKDVFRVVVEIKNSGRLPVEPSDYQMPLTVKALEGAEIISAIVEATSPPALKALVGDLQPRDGLVVLPKVLLNSGDQILIKLLVPEFAGLEVMGHAKGTTFRKFDSDKSLTYTLLIAGPVMAASGAIWLAITQATDVIRAISFPFMSMCFGLVLLFLGLFVRFWSGAFKYTKNDL